MIMIRDVIIPCTHSPRRAISRQADALFFLFPKKLKNLKITIDIINKIVYNVITIKEGDRGKPVTPHRRCINGAGAVNSTKALPIRSGNTTKEEGYVYSKVLE